MVMLICVLAVRPPLVAALAANLQRQYPATAVSGAPGGAVCVGAVGEEVHTLGESVTVALSHPRATPRYVCMARYLAPLLRLLLQVIAPDPPFRDFTFSHGEGRHVPEVAFCVFPPTTPCL